MLTIGQNVQMIQNFEFFDTITLTAFIQLEFDIKYLHVLAVRGAATVAIAVAVPGPASVKV